MLVACQPDKAQLETWRRGVVLEDGHRTAPARVWVEEPYGKGAWLRVVMHEGRKRQIREVAGLFGLPVVRIVRVRIGMLELGRLKAGEWRYLSEAEVKALKGQPAKARPGRISIKTRQSNEFSHLQCESGRGRRR